MASIVETRFPLGPIALALSTLFAAGNADAAPGDPLGPYFAVLAQPVPRQTQPSIARNASGEFVVVWTDQVSGAIFGRRFAADSAPLDGGFQISAAASSTAIDVVPAVAMDAAGDFVVAWQERQRPSYEGGASVGKGRLWARRYAADGAPAAAQFALEAASSTFDQGAPAVAMDQDGDYIVGWERASVGINPRLPGIGYGYESIHLGQRQVVAQRFAHTGAAQGTRLLAALRPDLDLRLTPIAIPIAGPAAGIFAASGIQDSVAVAMDASGDFVVAWGGNTYANAYAIVNIALPQAAAGAESSTLFAKRYNAQGQAKDLLPQTLDYSLGVVTVKSAPSVAMDPDGDYIVAWAERSGTLKSNSTQVYARRFNAKAARQGASIQVGAASELIGAPSVAADAAGDFVVAWQPADSQVNASRYSAAGLPLGTSLGVFGPSIGSTGACVAAAANGDFVVAWQQQLPYQSGDTFIRSSVFARAYAGP